MPAFRFRQSGGHTQRSICQSSQHPTLNHTSPVLVLLFGKESKRNLFAPNQCPQRAHVSDESVVLDFDPT